MSVQTVTGTSVDEEEIPSIERTKDGERIIETTVDCYVAGQYTDDRGRTFEVKQRYSINVRYSRSTLAEVMEELKRQIRDRFERKYSNYDCTVSEVFSPDLIAPRYASPLEMYRGRHLWKLLTRVDMRKMPSAQRAGRERARGLIKRYKRR